MRLVKSQLDPALDLVELLSRDAATMGVSELASRLDLPKSGVHRLLAHLVERGWVEQDPATQRYRLTLRLALLGQRLMSAIGLQDACQPVLDQLARRSRELVRMSLVQDEALVWVGSAQGSPPGLMYAPSMSGHIPLGATANGKAWLSTLPLEVAVRILEGNEPSDTPLGPNAIMDRGALLAELDRTRSRGWGLSVEEAEAGIVAIAAPIVLPQREAAIGAVSVAGPTLRITPDRYGDLARLISEAARDLAALWPVSPFGLAPVAPAREAAAS
jgi:IclR family transcriptional regulator, acetate operon repressor